MSIGNVAVILLIVVFGSDVHFLVIILAGMVFEFEVRNDFGEFLGFVLEESLVAGLLLEVGLKLRLLPVAIVKHHRRIPVVVVMFLGLFLQPRVALVGVEMHVVRD